MTTAHDHRARRFRFTHFVYTALWAIGSAFGALTVLALFSPDNIAVAAPLPPPATPFIKAVVWLSFVAIIGHQWLIYNSIHHLEDGTSPASSSAFIGRRHEVILRCSIFIVLLLIGGKLDAIVSDYIWESITPAQTYAGSLVVLFFLLLLWDLFRFLADLQSTKPRRAFRAHTRHITARNAGEWFGEVGLGISGALRDIVQSDKNGTLWFVLSDMLGFVISATFLLIASKRWTEDAMEWPAFVVVVYLSIIVVRLGPVRTIINWFNNNGPDPSDARDQGTGA